MNVLSLFDGMSCGQIALNRIGIKPAKYYASELDKYAIKVTQANYPDTIQLGDVTKWREWDIDWESIDLLIGGSPCQGFSFAGKQLAFDDPRSKLFFVYVDILNHIKTINPNVKFLLENVKMKREYLDIISEHLGVEPVFIDSKLVSGAMRQRYYWANWKIGQPEDKGINPISCIGAKGVPASTSYKNGSRPVKITKHFNAIVANYYKGIRASSRPGVLSDASFEGVDFNDLHPNKLRMLTPTECERLQTVLQYIKPVEIVLCLDQAKSFASAVEKNPKLLKLVSSAESVELKEYVRLATYNTKQSQAKIKHTVLQNADMQTQQQTKRCINTKQGELNLTASNVESDTTSKQAGSAESSATQSVFINITEGRTTHYGKAELRQIEQGYTEQMNGKIVLNLFGSETMQSAKDALSVLEMMQTNRAFTSITSFRLSTKNLDQMLIISYWFAKNVIDGFTQDTINKNILYLNLIDGYTAHVSNTQRYKMLGNGWTVDVIAHIFESGLI